MTVILDQPWQIYGFGLLQLRGRLELEVKTDLTFHKTHLGTTLQAANHVMNTNFRSKKAAYAEFCKRHDAMKELFGIGQDRQEEEDQAR